MPFTAVEKTRGVPRVTSAVGIFFAADHTGIQSTRLEAVTLEAGTVCYKGVAIVKNFLNKIIIKTKSQQKSVLK